MTPTEFYDWISQHKTRFSGLTKWLNDLRSAKQGVLDRWQETLVTLDIGDALEASKQMYAAAEKDRPRKYEDHPGEIVRRAKELAIKRTSRRDYARYQSTGARCQFCGGEGMASIFGIVDPETRAVNVGAFSILADVQTEGVGEINLRAFGVRCDCPAGEKYSGMPRLNPEQHVAVEGSKFWRADTKWWDKVAERLDRSSCAAFAGAVPTGGF